MKHSIISGTEPADAAKQDAEQEYQSLRFGTQLQRCKLEAWQIRGRGFPVAFRYWTQREEAR